MIFTFGPFSLDESSLEVRRDGVSIALQPKVRAVLFHLIRNRGRVVTKAELFETVWPNVVVGEASLARALAEVRRAIDDRDQTVIVTMRALGFRFAAEVHAQGHDTAQNAAQRPIGANAASSSIGKASGGSSSSSTLVGRDAAVQMLMARTAEASAGGARAVWVVGEAGIGKTHLLLEFARLVREHTPRIVVERGSPLEARAVLPANLNIVFALSDYDKRAALNSIKNKLDAHTGISIDTDDDPKKIQEYFVANKIENAWYGNGIFVAGIKPSVEPTVAHAARLRDAYGKIKKVYTWTVAKESTIDHFLRDLRSDGVMVNRPTIEAAVKIANQVGRLATRSDDAFKAVRGRGYKVVIKTGKKSGAGTDANIYFRMIGTKGKSNQYKLNPFVSGNAFENGEKDTIQLRAEDIGDVTSVNIESDNAWAGSGWNLDYVQVAADGGKTKKFDCNCWLESGKLSRTLK